jgi:hypothetical protein
VAGFLQLKISIAESPPPQYRSVSAAPHSPGRRHRHNRKLLSYVANPNL